VPNEWSPNTLSRGTPAYHFNKIPGREKKDYLFRIQYPNLIDRPIVSDDEITKNKSCSAPVTIINSFTSQFIREWLKTIDHGYYGELCKKTTIEKPRQKKGDTSPSIEYSPECLLRPNPDTNEGNEKNYNKVKDMETDIKNLKDKGTFVVRSVCNNESGDGRYYEGHWYFQTKYSPVDPTDNSVTLSNSYDLGWQVERSDQFCMVYSLFGATRKAAYWRKHRKDPYFFFKQVPKLKNDANVSDKKYNNAIQNANTKKLMMFLDKFLEKHPDVCDATMKSLKQPINDCGVNQKYTIDDVRKTIKWGIDQPERLLPTWKA
jgi:hypothetical protein